MFSQGQMAVLYDLPDQDYIDKNKSIKILAAPPGIQDINDFDINLSKEFYLNKGYKEVRIKLAPERTIDIGHNIQSQR